MQTNTPLMRAIEACGSQTALARACGVKQGHVWYWLNKAKQVPAEYAGLIEAATGGTVTKAELRPDIFDAPTPRRRPRRAPIEARPA